MTNDKTMKYLILGALIYFIYKFLFPPSLKEPAQQQQFKNQEAPSKKPRGDEEDFIEYEEVE